MKFTELKPEQQAQIIAFMSVFRPNVGLIARVMNKFAQMDGLWVTNISPLMAALDPGEVIPDPTGLAGAAPLMHEQVAGIMADVESVLKEHNAPANRAAFVIVAGPLNTIGD